MPAILARYRKARNGRAVPGEQAQLNTLVSAAGRSKAAERVLDETAGYLGAGIANLINLFNPERIVLSGWAGSPSATRCFRGSGRRRRRRTPCAIRTARR
jgi:predicted NBD/HSP70 family sugar kinase